MSIGELIILSVWGIGYLIIFFIQRNEIRSLKNVMNAMKEYMGIFEPQKIREMVKFMEEVYVADRDKAIEAIKAEASKSEATMMDMMLDLGKLLIMFSAPLMHTTFFDEVIHKANDGAAKNIFLKIVEQDNKILRDNKIDSEGQARFLHHMANSLIAGDK